MRILITGGCGFVGRRFVNRLLNDGHEVSVVDNISTGLPLDRWMYPPKDTKNLKLMFADVRSYFHAAKPHWFDLVIHCAAVVGGRLNIENDPLAVATDLSIDAELFNWIVRPDPGWPMPKLIYFSSSAVYPVELQTQKRNCALAEALQGFESARIGMPDMTYGFAKLSGEYLAKFAVEKYGLDVKIYRPFGGYGEDQDFNYPFPSIIRRIVRNESPVVVWGSGDQQRDFIYIDDIVEAVLSTMDVLHPGEVLNLGTGLGVSFYELAVMARDVLGKKFNITCDRSKPEGVFARVADPYKLNLLYTPKVTLRDGIKLVADAIEALDKGEKAA